MNDKQLRTEAKTLGFTVNKKDGEYIINRKGAAESKSYHTNDIKDAYDTMVYMSNQVVAEVGIWLIDHNRWLKYSDIHFHPLYLNNVILLWTDTQECNSWLSVNSTKSISFGNMRVATFIDTETAGT